MPVVSRSVELYKVDSHGFERTRRANLVPDALRDDLLRLILQAFFAVNCGWS
jgi:hypothetical protein